ncbi:MAG: hypothetical protein Q9220_001566 [cf. Caloplaca sp. 1 TL-2023]
MTDPRSKLTRIELGESGYASTTRPHYLRRAQRLGTHRTRKARLNECQSHAVYDHYAIEGSDPSPFPTTQPPTSPSPTQTATPAPAPSHRAPIIGGIIGGVLLILILLTCLICLSRRRHRHYNNKRKQIDSIGDSIVVLDVDDFPSPPQSQPTRPGWEAQKRRIEGRVRPPELGSEEMERVLGKVCFVDRRRGAVLQMGF